MGLRSLLSRQPAEPQAEDPLGRLAEIGRTEDPPAQFAGTTTRDGTAGASPVVVDKKSVGLSVAISEKKQSEPSRSRSGYVWVSQKSREAGSEAMRFANSQF